MKITKIKVILTFIMKACLQKTTKRRTMMRGREKRGKGGRERMRRRNSQP